MTSDRFTRSGYRTRRAAVLAAVVAAVLSTCVFAQTDRLRRGIHEIPGVPAGAADMAQDRDGYVWIVGNEGLARFDGIEALRWAPEVIKETLDYVSTGTAGGIVAGNTRSGLYEVIEDGAKRVHGPNGEPLFPVQHALYDTNGNLWVAVGGVAMNRTPDGTWTRLDGDELGREYAWRFGALTDGSVAVGTLEGGVWRVDAGRDTAVRAMVRGLGGAVNRIVPESDGSIVATVRSRGVVRVDERSVEDLLREPSRPTGLARRGDVIWAVFTGGVFAVRDGRPPQRYERRDGFVGSGSVMVDRSGGLWRTSYRGVELYPEPDTIIWTRASDLGRFQATSVIPEARGGVWASTWDGPMFRRTGESEWSALELEEWWTAHDGCLDAGGRVWASAWPRDPGEGYRTALLRWDEGRLAIRLPRPGPTHVYCDRGPDGVTWMVYGRDLLRLAPGDDVPAKVLELPTTSENPAALAIDDTLGMAVAMESEFCSAPATTFGAPSGWTCHEVPGAVVLRDLEVGPDGHWWVASEFGGVLALRDGAWEAAHPDIPIHDPRIVGLTRSPRGGLWIATGVEKVRVDHDGDRLRLVERLTPWNGVPAWWGGRVSELADGGLWIPTGGGPVYVPASARREAGEAPDIYLTRMIIDGVPRDNDSFPELPAGEHRIEAHFATFAFRDLDNLMYRMRSGGGPWSPLGGPSLSLIGMSAGDHDIEVAASVDGASWSSVPARLSFVVARAWYSTAWAWLGIAFVVWVAAFATYRVRTTHLLRLERQRVAIAMDLHDEMGATVGSIGIMAGVAADDGAGAEQRREVSRKIADAAEELGASLYDIVWSLRIEGARFGDLAAQLIERGTRLFPGDRPRFSTVMPEDWPASKLSLQVRRDVQRIVVEALHNAAKYADASRVILGFAGDDDRCTVWVEDDGVGLVRSRSVHGGSRLGLDGMRTRANRIGARLRIEPGLGGGTRVELVFRPDGTPWKPRASRRDAADRAGVRTPHIARHREETP